MLGALVGAALLTLAWFATFHVSLVERADLSIFHSFGELGVRLSLDSIVSSITRLCNETEYLVLCAVPVLVALARRRFWLAAEISLILAGANLTTRLLKTLFAHRHPDSALPATSWPSGHTTAAVALAVCCVLAAPARVRRLVALGGAGFVIAIAFSLLLTDTHYPSDVVAGFLVAGIWAALGIGAARLVREDRRPVPALPGTSDESLGGRNALDRCAGVTDRDAR